MAIEQWRRDRIAEVYALTGCKVCNETGRRYGKGTCHCVLRRACRIAVGKWRSVQHRFPGRFKEILFRCDVEIAAAHVLDALHMQVFRLHFLYYQDWRACCLALGLDKGAFFHAVYRIEGRLGRELLRRGIFPLEVYFDFGREPLYDSRRGHTITPMLSRGDFKLRADEYALAGYSEPPAAMRSAA